MLKTISVSLLWIVVVVPGISVSHYLPLQDSCTSSRCCTVIIIVMIIFEGFFSIHLWCQRAGWRSHHRLIQNVRCISSLLLCCWWGLLGFRKQKQKRGSSNSSRVYQVRILHIHRIKSSESVLARSGYHCINISITSKGKGSRTPVTEKFRQLFPSSLDTSWPKNCVFRRKMPCSANKIEFPFVKGEYPLFH